MPKHMQVPKGTENKTLPVNIVKLDFGGSGAYRPLLVRKEVI